MWILGAKTHKVMSTLSKRAVALNIANNGSYAPIGAVEGAAAGAAVGGTGVAVSIGGAVLSLVACVAIAATFSVLVANLNNRVDTLTTQLNTSGATIRMLEETVVELVEASGINITYTEFATGYCELYKGCNNDLYHGTFRLLLGQAGPFLVLVGEIGVFDTLVVRKREDPHPKRPVRAPGDTLELFCYNEGPGVESEFFPDLSTTTSTRFLTPAQLANFNLTGPNLGNGGGLSFVDGPPLMGSQQTYSFYYFLDSQMSVTLYWYPDYAPCDGDDFNLLAPTRFTIAVTPFIGSFSKKKKKHETAAADTSKNHKKVLPSHAKSALK